MIKINKLTSAIVLSLYGLSATAQVSDKDINNDDVKLEVIQVTASKRVENLQNVAGAVNAFTADVIEEAGINNAHDLAAMTPSLGSTEARSPFQSRLSIRGIGTAQNDPALEPSVGIFVNGVFLGRTGLGMSELTDIERIEVLQGPQGTLYGKNTNAGAISVITKLPDTEEFEGLAEVSFGNYGMKKVTLAATGPLTETLAYRLSGNTLQRDGYYDNLSGADPSDADNWNLQGKLLWEPNDNLSVIVSGSHVERDSNCCGTDVTLSEEVQTELALQGLPQGKNGPYDYEIANDTESAFVMETDFVSLHIVYDMGWGDFSSISSFNEYEYFTRSDADGSQLDIIRNLGEDFSGDSFAQEFRLDAMLNDNIDYQIGLFYHDQTSQRGDGGVSRVLGDDFLTIAGQRFPSLDINHPVLGPLSLPATLTLPAIAQPGDSIGGKNVWQSETLAAFGQITWHATENLHLNAGLRWTDEDKEAELLTETSSSAGGIVTILRPPQAGGPLHIPLPASLAIPFVSRLSTPIDATLDRNSQNTDWLLKASYDLDHNTMIYTSASTGTKSGNFNGVFGTPDQREFDDEETLSYELGMKSTFLDSTLRLNSAAFYTEVDNYQFQQALALGGVIVKNDAQVVVSGLDISLEALPFENLTLTAGLLYMDKYEVTEGPSKGKSLPYTADFSGNLGATLVFPIADGMLYIRGDYIFMGDHTTSNANNLRDADTDDRQVFNAKIGWRNDDWNVSIWAKNLTDDEYASVTNATQSFSGNAAYVLAPPKTIGATVRYNF
jgi:iron complex outermembrane receptor protein